MQNQAEFNEAVDRCIGDRGKRLGNVGPSPYDLFKVVAVVHDYYSGYMVRMEFSINPNKS